MPNETKLHITLDSLPIELETLANFSARDSRFSILEPLKKCLNENTEPKIVYLMLDEIRDTIR